MYSFFVFFYSPLHIYGNRADALAAQASLSRHWSACGLLLKDYLKQVLSHWLITKCTFLWSAKLTGMDSFPLHSRHSPTSSVGHSQGHPHHQNNIFRNQVQFHKMFCTKCSVMVKLHDFLHSSLDQLTVDPHLQCSNQSQDQTSKEL